MDDEVLLVEAVIKQDHSIPHWEQDDPRVALNEHLADARLPEVYGVSRRVIQNLLKRIGHSSLEIDHIASDLNYSTRTLQRRLRAQGFSFSELRDMVRRNYSVNAILVGKLRVEDIYIALDFSDRSSLTLAFKRWTGYSPRAFGRLYRDYIEQI